MELEESKRNASAEPAPVSIRCYAELNDYLPPGWRQVSFPWPVTHRPRLEDVVAELRVPPERIDVALVNGGSASLDHRLAPGDRVALYPVFEALDVTPLCRLPGRPLRRTRFVADVHLARLARLLRMLGFDTLWWRQARDDDLVGSAEAEERVLLTRDRALASREDVTRALWVWPATPGAQVAAVLDRLDLYAQVRPFTRCMICNGQVTPVPKETVAGRVPAGALREHGEFFDCAACGRVYWKGSHYRNMRAWIDRLMAARASCTSGPTPVTEMAPPAEER